MRRSYSRGVISTRSVSGRRLWPIRAGHPKPPRNTQTSSPQRFELRRGFELARGERVIVVEDIVTTGLSIRECIACVRELGADVVAAACLVDRSAGAAEIGVPLVALTQYKVPAYPADALPPGCEGLTLTTRLNGQVVQQAPVGDMVFPVATLISILSSFLTLRPGDLIVTGTPSGVGLARKPPLWMKPGDVCEVEIDGIGLLSNPVHDEA